MTGFIRTELDSNTFCIFITVPQTMTFRHLIIILFSLLNTFYENSLHFISHGTLDYFLPKNCDATFIKYF